MDYGWQGVIGEQVYLLDSIIEFLKDERKDVGYTVFYLEVENRRGLLLVIVRYNGYRQERKSLGIVFFVYFLKIRMQQDYFINTVIYNRQ